MSNTAHIISESLRSGLVVSLCIIAILGSLNLRRQQIDHRGIISPE